MYIFLFKIKRFFSIFKKEISLFIKKKTEKKTKIINIKKIKKIIDEKDNLEIKLDKKKYNFYDLYPVYKEKVYIESPTFKIIKNNKNSILNNLINILSYYDFKINIGIELEFYILNNKKLNIVKELKQNIKEAKDIEEEKGNFQYEIKTNTYTDIKKFIYDYEKILEKLNNFSKKNNLIIDYTALPFNNDCGNALQINLSILDQNNNNLFARKKEGNEIKESELLLNCIAGFLENINNKLLLYINNKNSLKRFSLEKNIKIKNLNKYPAPTFVSWGINNRTTSIRIPTPSNITDFKKYFEEDNKSRRIEFRVPSADADLKLVLIGVLYSVIYGIDNNLYPKIDKTSFDVLLKNDNLEKIETDFLKIQNIFKIDHDILLIDKLPIT